MTKEKIIEGVKKVAAKLGRAPRKSEYDKHREEGYLSEWTIRNMYGYKWSEIRDEACPDYDNGWTRSLNRSDLHIVKKNTQKTKRFFVTAATAGANVNKDFFESVQTFCQAAEAELVILPMRGSGGSKETYLSDVNELSEYFATEYQLNNKLVAQDLGITPQQQKPLSGLDRLGQKEYSIIIASPKQQMKVVPTGNAKWPHILHSTGAITEPSYRNDKTGKLAFQDHVLGGLIVETNGNEFYIRQIQANADGSFYDLDKRISKDGVQDNEAVALVLGDIHSGSEDESAMNTWNEVIGLTKPRHIILHDVFDGLSINHHINNDINTQSQVKQKIPSLEYELDSMATLLNSLSQSNPNQLITIVKSNHDEFLDRYLSEARYVKDSTNYRLALDLAILKHDVKENIFQTYFETKGYNWENINWLERQDDFKVEGVQCGSHGDLGLNGARGNANSTETAYANAVVGHTHSPSIVRDTWTVGTSTKLRLGYNRGPSSWLHASCLIHEGGKKQMIISIKGNWKI